MDFRVGQWLVLPGLNRLVCGSRSFHVTPKSMQVLACLAKRGGSVVPRDEIFKEVWPETFVTDDALIRCVGELRRVFRSSRKPAPIETIAKCGYRISAPVAWCTDDVVNGQETGYASASRPAVKEPESAPARGAEAGPPESSMPEFALGRSSWHRRWLLVLSCLVLLAAVVLIVGSSPVRTFLGIRRSAPAIRSLAVLPLADLSGNSEQEYFADGMTEELITQLAHLEAWKVISRTSVMRYKRSGKAVPAIARELAVDAVIEGAVRRSGNRVRITAQLIRADGDTHVWSRSFERELSDVLVLQREIASEIAAELRVKTLANVHGLPGRNRRMVPEAYESYLKGRYLLFRGQYSRAASEFEQATADDPGFALAHALLFEAEGMESYRRDLPLSDRAMRAMERARVLDGSLAEVQTCLGDVKFFNQWDWAAGETAFRRATEIDPASFDAAIHYAGCLRILCRWDAAEKEIKRALQLDPVSPRINAGWLGFLIDAHRYKEAVRQFETIVQFDPNSGPAHSLLGLLHQIEGRDSEALDAFLRSDRLQGRSPDQCIALEAAGKRGGVRGYWRKRIELLSRQAEQSRVPPLDFASLYVRIGENDKSMQMLEAAYQQHAPRLVWIRANALWDPLRSDPRFQSLLRRMRFPE